MPRSGSRVRVSFPAPGFRDPGTPGSVVSGPRNAVRLEGGLATALFSRHRPGGRVVMQRTANPRTPVRFRPWPPVENPRKSQKASETRIEAGFFCDFASADVPSSFLESGGISGCAESRSKRHTDSQARGLSYPQHTLRVLPERRITTRCSLSPRSAFRMSVDRWVRASPSPADAPTRRPLACTDSCASTLCTTAGPRVPTQG